MPGGEPALMTADTLGALQSQIEKKMTIPKAHQALMVNGVKVPRTTPYVVHLRVCVVYGSDAGTLVLHAPSRLAYCMGVHCVGVACR